MTTQEQLYQTFSKTAVGVMVMADCVPGVKAGGSRMGNIRLAQKRIEAASRLLATRYATKGGAPADSEQTQAEISFEDLHRWQLANEAAVPTVCLTSKMDLVVPECGVRAYAAALQAGQPGRDVRVVLLKVAH